MLLGPGHCHRGAPLVRGGGLEWLQIGEGANWPARPEEEHRQEQMEQQEAGDRKNNLLIEATERKQSGKLLTS